MSLRIQVFGINELKGALLDLPRSLQNRHMRIAMNAGGGVIRDAAVARAPRETGLLKRSLKVKVRVPDASFSKAHHGKSAYAVIGPSRQVVGVQKYRKSWALGGFKTVRLARRKKGEQDRFQKSRLIVATTLRRPSRYSHLVEKGTKRGVKAVRFLAGAARSAGSLAKAAIVRKLNQGISEWASQRRVNA